MDIKGKVHEIGEVQNVSDKFRKRDLVVEYIENPAYPEYIKFEATQEKVNILDNVKVGEQIEVFFNLRGRPWTDRNGKTTYFNTLNVWRINILGAEQASASASPEYAPPVDISAAPGEEDDLPF